MKYSNIILGGLVAFAGTAVAMPTQEETKKVEPLVLDLMKDDQVALKSGKKSRVEVAESAIALADKADSEAAKLLLMKGAFNLYVRAGEFDKAIETLQALQAAIPDIPPANMANIIEASLRVVSRKNGGQLYRLLDETKTRMRYTSAAKKMEKALKENPNDRQLRTKLAEHYAYLGKWDKALENFIAADGKVGAIAKAEQGGEAGEKTADFWWSYPTGKADELVKPFRTHAAKLYEDALADGKITGLDKVQAERRIEETKGYGEQNLFTASAEKDGLYCVIDLSKGPNAKHYPVSYLKDVPKGGWSDEYKTTKLVLRKINAGKFKMGDLTHDPPQQPRSDVNISQAFYIGIFEITQRQWELVMGDRPSYFTNVACYAMRPVENVSFKMIRGSVKGTKWPSSSDVDKESFLFQLREKAGLIIDLPTSAQWEYACRAGRDTDYNLGENSDPYKRNDPTMNKAGRYRFNGGWNDEWGTLAWSKEALSHVNRNVYDDAGTSCVGRYLPNQWGIYDMHGNVEELCLDWKNNDTTPFRVDPVGPMSGKRRISRSGSFLNWPCSCGASLLSAATMDEKTMFRGFRLTILGHRANLTR